MVENASVLDLTAEQLAAQFAPIIHFDDNEPFRPVKVGFSVLGRDDVSPSSPHQPTWSPRTATVIEYAIWSDWDIGHIFELEHVWVFVDTDGLVERVDGSQHGTSAEITNAVGDLPIRSGRIQLFAEPGKHAIAGAPTAFRATRAQMETNCNEGAGSDRFEVPELFAAQIKLTPYDRFLTRQYLQQHRFVPSGTFGQIVDLRDVECMAWPRLAAEIPDRVSRILADLRRSYSGVKAVFLDSGDTLIDEGSQVFDDRGIVLAADPIPTGGQLVERLKEKGYLVALVADGFVESFEIVHRKLGFYDLFDSLSISETVGVDKPHRAMFDRAVDSLGLEPADLADVVMVGNNLHRDIEGAKTLGMWTVWINWSTRRSRTPQNDLQKPDYTIELPDHLLGVLETIEATYP